MSIKTSFVHKVAFFFLTAMLLSCLPAAAAGKTLLLLPLAVYSDQSKDFLRPGLQSMFVSRLSGEDLQVVSEDRLLPLLNEKEKEGVNSKERAEELARTLNADYAVFGSVTSVGAGYSVDLSLLDLTKKEPELTRITRAFEEDQLIPKLADMVYDIRAVMAGVDIRPQKAALSSGPEPQTKSVLGLFHEPGAGKKDITPAGRVSLGMGVMAFDTGDLDGDGLPELVVLGREKLLIYDRKDKALEFRGGLDTSLGEEFLKVSVADVSGDGKAEIYLVSSGGMRAESSIYEWAGKLRRISKTGGHLRAVKAGNAGPVLLSQDSVVSHYFSGSISVMAFDGAKALTPKEKLPEFKEGVQFYTLTPLDPKRGKNTLYVGLNLDSYVCLWDGNGTLLWRSKDKVGGTNNTLNPARSYASDYIQEIQFNSRILVKDIDRNGKNEIVVIDNVPLSKHVKALSVINESSLVAYTREAAGLSPLYNTGTFPFCLTDLQQEGKTLYLAAQKGKIMKFGAGAGAILWFE
jgi:hypothetical protein